MGHIDGGEPFGSVYVDIGSRQQCLQTRETGFVTLEGDGGNVGYGLRQEAFMADVCQDAVSHFLRCHLLTSDTKMETRRDEVNVESGGQVGMYSGRDNDGEVEMDIALSASALHL